MGEIEEAISLLRSADSLLHGADWSDEADAAASELRAMREALEKRRSADSLLLTFLRRFMQETEKRDGFNPLAYDLGLDFESNILYQGARFLKESAEEYIALDKLPDTGKEQE